MSSPEIEDQLEFLVDIHAGNDVGLDRGMFTVSAVQQFWVIEGLECGCESRSLEYIEVKVHRRRGSQEGLGTG